MGTKGFRAHVRIRRGGKTCFSPRQILTLRNGVGDPALMAQSRGRVAYPVDPVNPVKICFIVEDAALDAKFRNRNLVLSANLCGRGFQPRFAVFLIGVKNPSHRH